jgi:hypothetical protein
MKLSQQKPAKVTDKTPLEVEGVQVHIQWDGLILGSSFFIPCLDERKLCFAVQMRARNRGVKLKAVPRVENGLWGVRFWCVKL